MKPVTDPQTGNTTFRLTDPDRKTLARAKSLLLEAAVYSNGSEIALDYRNAAATITVILSPEEDERLDANDRPRATQEELLDAEDESK